MVDVKGIAKYMMETGVKETSEGNWCFRLDELDGRCPKVNTNSD